MLELFRPVVEHANPITVRVLTNNDQLLTLGTIVDAQGLILTKASELSGEVICELHDGRRLAARRVAADHANDLALLQVEATDLSTAVWSNEPVRMGRWAVTTSSRRDAAAFGVISVLPRSITARRRRALMGVQLTDHDRGARIAQLSSGFGAEDAGLQVGDIITWINNNAIQDARQPPRLLRRLKPGDTITVKALRGEEEVQAEVEMRNRPKPGASTRGRGRLNGELSGRLDGFENVFQHDAVLHPDQCGGPVVNLDGEVIGLNIARAGRVATYALPANLVQRRLEQMKKRLGAPKR